jgi:predicted PurR-regulated permease PerM
MGRPDRRPASGEDRPPFKSTGDRAARVRTVSVAVLAVLAVVFALRQAAALFIPLVIGVLLGYALGPVVEALARRRVPRPLGAALVVAVLLAVAGGAAYGIRDQAVAVVDQLPDAARQLREQLAERRGGRPGGPLEKVQEAAEELEQAAQEASPARARVTPGGALRVQVEESPLDVYSYLWSGSLGLALVTLQAAMVLFLVFFLLMSGDLLRRKLLVVVGPEGERAELVGAILEEIRHKLARFLLVRVATNAVVAVATGLALWALGLAQPAVWGLLAGVFNTIPYLGPFLVTVGLAIVAFLQFGTPEMALAVAGIALLITSIEGWLISPPLLGRAARMNAVAVFLALIFWSWVWGPLGLLLAVPIMVVVKTLCDHFDGARTVGHLLGD